MVAMLVLMVEARRRKPGGTCGLSCYRSIFVKSDMYVEQIERQWHLLQVTSLLRSNLAKHIFQESRPGAEEQFVS